MIRWLMRAMMISILIGTIPLLAHASDWFIFGARDCQKSPVSPADLMRTWDDRGIEYTKDDVRLDGELIGVLLTKKGDAPANFFKDENACNSSLYMLEMQKKLLEEDREKRLDPYK